MKRLWIQSFLRWPRSKTLLVIFLCYFLPFVNCYQWKLKIPKQFSNITSLVSCMLWCIVSCIVSWHLYRDMYQLLRKCIVAALFFSHFCFQSRIFQCVVSISCQLTQSYAPATKTRGSFVTLVLSSKCLPLQLSYNWHRPLISQRYGKTLDSKFFTMAKE